MFRKYFFIISILFLFKLPVQAQEMDGLYKKYYVGSSLFMLANLVADAEPPHYFQLNVGYRFNARNIVSLEMIRWDYYEPLGVPYSEKKKASNFPGKVRAFGVGLAYQRFFWKRGYVQVHSAALKQNYLDEKGNIIQSGFQLFNTVRAGYQFRFFKNRVFLEPSIACTFWPVNTNLPASFQVQENKFPNYFLGEPGLHFGFNF